MATSKEMTLPLKWHGGKHYLAPELRKLALQVDHLHRAEVFAGGASFTLAMPCDGYSEVINDVDKDLTLFWRVLQGTTSFLEFERVVQAVPFSECEWNDAQVEFLKFPQHSPAISCEVVRAVRFFIRCRQSLAGRQKSFAPTSRNRTRRRMNEQVSAWLSCVEGLPEVHNRLKRVFVMDTGWQRCIKLNDGPKTLFYLDPPYHPETRTAKEIYAHEMTASDHEEMLKYVTASERAGKFIVSHYRHDLYDRYLQSWQRHDFELPNNAASGKKKKRMTECVWCSW